MSEERLPCLTPGCPNTIQPATAKRTGGYCGPCDGKRRKAAWDEHVRKNRRDVDLYAGISDPVELLRIMHQRRQHDPLVNLLPPPRTLEQIYTALTAEQARRVMEIAIERLLGGDDEAEDMAKLLAVFTDFDLEPMLAAWVERDEFWPPVIFRGASATIRDRIIGRLEGTARPDHAMQALAWIGDASVVAFFRQCAAASPAWAADFYIGPADFARVAGWELAPVGRRELCFPHAVAITPASDASAAVPSTHIARSTDQHCPWCGRALVNLLEIELADQRFAFLEWPLPRLQVLTCDMCTCFGDHVYAELDEAGHGHWSPQNKPPRIMPKAEQWGPVPWAGVPLVLSPRRAIHASDWCLPTTLSQIGGFPAWVQDMAYPNCSKCGETMLFLAQIDNAQFRGHEGVYYAFVCRDCRTTATTYQQT